DLMNIKAHHAGAILNLFEKWLDERIGSIAHDADAARAWQDLADQLEVLRRQLGRGCRQARDVALRPREVGDQSSRNRIAGRSHDDRDVACRVLCGDHCRRLRGYDDVDLAANQFLGHADEAIDSSTSLMKLKLDG